MKIKAMLIVLIAVWCSIGLAAAQTHELGYGTEEVSITLQPNEEAAYAIPLKVGDVLEVELEVVSGGPVDFYLTNLTAYNLYRASITSGGGIDSLYYLADYSRNECGGIGYTYDSLVENELVVLLDNTAYLEGGAAPIGPVSIEGSIRVHQNVWTWQNIAVTTIVIGLIVGFMALARLPKRSR